MRLDLGGWLGQGSLLWRFGQPLSEAMLRSWLEPMLLSVVMLRDKVGRLARLRQGAWQLGEGLRQ